MTIRVAFGIVRGRPVLLLQEKVKSVDLKPAKAENRYPSPFNPETTMMIRTTTYLILLLSVSGCATVTPTEPADRDELPSVSFLPTTLAEGAYEEPDGTKSPNVSGELAKVGGALPRLIGEIVDASVKSSQQEDFVAQNNQYFQAIESGMPGSIVALVDQKFKDVVKTSELFGDRIVEHSDSDNTFQTKVLHYGLARTFTSDEKMYMGYRLSVEVKLLSRHGETRISRIFTATSPVSHTLQEYTDDTTLLAEVAEMAVHSVGRDFKNYLKKKRTIRSATDSDEYPTDF